MSFERGLAHHRRQLAMRRYLAAIKGILHAKIEMIETGCPEAVKRFRDQVAVATMRRDMMAKAMKDWG